MFGLCVSSSGSNCVIGYSLNNVECRVNKCTCGGFGKGLVGSGCPGYKQPACSKCFLGYYIKGNQCVPNKCTCGKIGSPLEGPGCPWNGGFGCSTCEKGYHLVKTAISRRCRPNRCICAKSGAPKIGPGCPRQGAKMCANCFPGHHLSATGATCKPNRCLCGPGGVDLIGRGCPATSAKKCKSCKKGFYLGKDGFCKQNRCQCTNGTPKISKACKSHLDVGCDRCDVGFRLRDGACIPNKCICPLPKFNLFGPGCLKDGGQGCHACPMCVCIHVI